MKAIEKLKAWLDANGRSQVQLSEAIQVSTPRVSRFLRGLGPLPDLAAYRRAEAFCGGAVHADELVAESSPSSIKKRRGVTAVPRSGGRPKLPPWPSVVHAPAPAPPPEPEVPSVEDLAIAPPVPGALSPVLAEYARDVAERSGCGADLLLFERLVEVSMFGRTEGVRLKAIQMILDRAHGTPLQKVQDLTIHEPAQHSELVATFATLRARLMDRPAITHTLAPGNDSGEVER